MNQKNIYNKPLKICSTNPMTGYNRDGYCRPDVNDYGSHLVCAKMDKQFLDFTESRNNPLRSVVKEGDRWCLCQDRYYEAKIANKAPKVIKNASHKNIKPIIKTTLGGTKRKIRRKNKSKKRR